MNNDNECSINYNNINSNDDDDEDGDDINYENEIHIIMFFSVFFCMIIVIIKLFHFLELLYIKRKVHCDI